MRFVKRFSGILNIDDPKEDVLSPQHIAAKNGVFVGGQSGLTFQNIKGNVLIPNSNLPAGDNECIGAFFDSVNQLIFWFNYNSNGRNGIYQYSIQTGAITKIFLCFTDSATDILNFSLDYPVSSCSIVYRSSSEGNLLYWTDGLNAPKYLNLSTVATLAPFTEDMVNAAKNPPLSPPVVSYGSDAVKNYNNVHNRYFRFSYRWVYKDQYKSTFSPTSILALPESITNPEIETPSNVNNYISVSVLSGDTEDFQGIEIYCQEFDGASWGDFSLINTVNRDDIVTPIPFLYSFSFYNDGIYSTISPSESDLRFDWLPDKANTLELLNGNTIIYGGITEGYDQIERADVDVQVTSSLATGSAPTVVPAWKWGQNERLGLIYFDKRGKTNGVVSFLGDATIDTTNFDTTSPQYPGSTLSNFYQVPKLSGSINSTPPTWAETYQWVRLDLAPPFFLQYVTNDYQTDNQYMYLCIQDLTIANTQRGFIPSYEFESGDRVKVMAKFNSTLSTSVYSTQYDYEILGVVERPMGGPNPPSTGRFLKCLKPQSFPTPGYSANMFIEIYRPPASVNNSTAIFWEWGQKYAIYESGGNRYHRGQIQDQTGSQPALFEWFNGYVYQKQREIPGINPNTNIGSLIVMDRRYNDYQDSSAANSNSRGWPIDVNAKQQYFPVTSRWGGSYIQDTNINNLNRFYPQDLDTIDRGKGDIRRFKVRDRILRVFQDRGVGQYGVYAKYIQNNEGNPQLVTTDSIITTNNINYYAGTYGLGGYSTNLVSTQQADYFTDVVTGRGIRLSGDGLTDLGLLYKGQYYFTQLVTPYNKQLLRTNGSIAKVMAFFDYFYNEFHTVLQGGTGDGTTTEDQHFSFNETRNGYCCDRYDYHPEWAISAADVIYSWKEGQLYIHNGSTYCNFYGTQYSCDISVVFNDNLFEKKTWESIIQLGSDTWSCPLIYTNVNSYGTTKQTTTLVSAEFTKLEDMASSAIKRDANSIGGKVNGSIMKGNYCVVKFEKASASELITLSEIIIRAIDSPLTVK